MLTCVYHQPPVPLSLSGNKNCLIKVNRELDTKKVIVSKFTEDRSGRVKVEVASTNKTLNQILRSRHKSGSSSSSSSSSSSEIYKSSKGKHHHSSTNSLNSWNNNEDSWESAYSSDSEPLSESCGLSISELEEMAARQARQLETQDQLLAAKAQRLRFLKSSGEAERLQRLREKVATQEERLRKLRALRGKVQANRNGNSVLSADLESLRSVFNEKEKELSLAVAKVDELTRQLEDIRRNSKEQPQNGQSPATLELEKLKRELLYRHKLRETQSNRVLNQKQSLSQKQDEAMRVDRRIAELQDRLHRKRILNSQLAASLKHQENEEDFVSLPSKNDPKYQTLPYNAKLFTPFANKHEQDQFEKSMQQMQIIKQNQHQQNQTQAATAQLQFQVQQYHQQQQQQLQQSNNPGFNGINNAAIKDNSNTFADNERIQSFNNKNNLALNQLQSFLSQQQQGNQVEAKSNSSTSNNSNGTSTSSRPQSTQATNNNTTSKGKNESDVFPMVRPSNFVPTGAPASSPSSSNSSTSNNLISFGGQVPESPTDSGGCYDEFSQFSSDCGTHSKPALPPKPKPTPPPRQAQEFGFGAGSRIPSSSSLSDEIMIPDRTELPIKSKPLFLKNSQYQQQNTITSTSSTEKESSSSTTNTTVRVSINRRRIEMPPAFLFPESDPPPSDLVPEQHQPSSTNPENVSGQSSNSQTQQQNAKDSDSTDASPSAMLIKAMSSQNNQKQIQAEEYTLPDLFPNPPQIKAVNNNKEETSSSTNNNHINNNNHLQSSNNGPTSPRSSDMSNDGNSNSEVANQNHIALLKLLEGESGFENENERILSTNNQGQLDKFEAGSENNHAGDGSEQSPEREEIGSDSTVSTTNNVPGLNVPGVLRRVKKSNFKSAKRDQIIGRRVSFDPLALLLDASLEGELDLVMKTATEVGNVSAANDEGITALHNAICAGHAEVVRFLVEFGCDVNAQDSDGWTPLHCAASCNNVGMVKFLVEHGACIFATTLSDHETAAEKCEEDEDGFGPCSEYLYSIQEKLGIMNNGVVYSVFEYEAQNQDELDFHDGERLVILRKGDEYEREWWWAAAAEKQGYVPRNLLGLYPRVVPQKHNNGES